VEHRTNRPFCVKPPHSRCGELSLDEDSGADPRRKRADANKMPQPKRPQFQAQGASHDPGRRPTLHQSCAIHIDAFAAPNLATPLPFVMRSPRPFSAIILREGT
jgi:hypothetical protein